MNTTGLEVATRQDLDGLLGLREQLGAWLASRGIDQWQTPMPRERLRSWIDDDAVLVHRAGGRIAGAVALLQDDPEIWGDDDGVAARYVHLLMVDRAFAGRGLGDQILRRAEGHAHAAGARRVRLDAAADNARLQAWYADRGYAAVASRVIVDGARRFHLTLREKGLEPDAG